MAKPTTGSDCRQAAGLMSLLCPHTYCRSIYDVDVRELKSQGIEGLIVDADNTLVEWSKHEATEELKAWFRKADEAGVRCCILSNSLKVSQIASFAGALGANFIAPAIKPMPSSFHAAMRLLGTGRSNTVVIGDQVFTDILGGNALGLRTILVRPVCEREFAWTRLLRRLERLVLRHLRRRGLISRDSPPE